MRREEAETKKKRAAREKNVVRKEKKWLWKNKDDDKNKLRLERKK